MEKFLAADGFGADPHLFFPIAHCIRISCAILVAGTYKVMWKVFMLLQKCHLVLCIFISPFIRIFFNLNQCICKVGSISLL